MWTHLKMAKKLVRLSQSRLIHTCTPSYTLHYRLGIETWFLKRNLSSEAHFGPMGFQQLEVIFKNFYDLLKNVINFRNIFDLQKWGKQST